MKIFCLIVTCFMVATLSTATDNIKPKQATPNYRLPDNVIPSNYQIVIEPFFAGTNEFTFNGQAAIIIQPANATNEIVLHINQLTINEPLTRLTLSVDVGSEITIDGTKWDSLTHLYTLYTGSTLLPNTEYSLSFVYTGILSDDMQGFYRSSYVENQVTKWLAATQLQPEHARRVFPCFDEPKFKATFDITIIRSNNHSTTVSNTKLISSTVLPDGTQRTRDTFAQTPIMSTYLVAFIVSEFGIRSNSDGTFRVIARPDVLYQTAWAHEIGPKLLSQMESYLDYPYSSVAAMTKMEIAALPEFLSAGAMENWGLLTFRETALVYDINASTASAQQRVTTTIAHEQAHMWFGNLVTCDWWEYTWLNEGFARYFTYHGPSLLQETYWDLPYQFVVEQLQEVMRADALETSHPLSNIVNSPTEIAQIFDSIAYSKGATVIRMTEHIMGTNNFRAALQQYLRANAYQTATPQKLYDSFQPNVAESVLQVAEFLNTWTTQTGYPVVTVVRDKDDKKLVTISQKRFLLRNASHDDSSRWEIKLNYATSQQKNFEATHSTLSMGQNQTTVTLTLPHDVDWIIFNIQQTGYYRVNYDTETWENISQALKVSNFSGIHVLNRAQIVDDSLNFARGDLLDYKLALSVIQYLEDETNYLPWLAAFNNLIYVQRRFAESQSDVYRKYILGLIHKIYNTLGFCSRSSDTRIDIYNRANILSYACKFGHQGCIESAVTEFNSLIQQPQSYSVPVNVRPIVYCTAITEGNATTWNWMWSRFLTMENVAAERFAILAALGCTKDRVLLTEYLDKILTDSVRLHDKQTAFTSTYDNHDSNVQTVLDYVTANYAAVRDSFGSIDDVARILSNLAARFSNSAQIQQLEAFYAGKESEFGSVTITTALATAKYDLQWSERHVEDIYNYMKAVSSARQLVSVTLLLFMSAVLVCYAH